MISSPILIDTNLLVLFVVGMASRKYIKIHKRLSIFVEKDYDTLLHIISTASEVLITPNTLTETSNLAAHIAEPARSHIFETFRSLVEVTQETYIPSRTASVHKEFIRLGLTDASIMEMASKKIIVLTTDLQLYLAICTQGNQAINFNHLRGEYL